MPTYEYKCEKCGNQFEIFQSIKDDPLTWCAKCGHDSLKKLISVPAGLIFKGTGFYLTDYKKTGSKSESATTKKTLGKKDKQTESVKSKKDSKADSKKN